MECLDQMSLAEYIDYKEKSLKKILTSEQMRSFKTWAREVPSDDHRAHLIPIIKIPSIQLKTYLGKLIPGFPQGGK